MSVALKLDMPEGAFSALRKAPEEFTREMRLAAAVKWYEMGTISQEKAAEIAGLSRAEFIASLSRFKVSPFQYTAQEAAEELRDAD
jgi:predicted HTH domain antitoxin